MLASQHDHLFGHKVILLMSFPILHLQLANLLTCSYLSTLHYFAIGQIYQKFKHLRPLSMNSHQLSLYPLMDQALLKAFLSKLVSPVACSNCFKQELIFDTFSAIVFHLFLDLNVQKSYCSCYELVAISSHALKAYYRLRQCFLTCRLPLLH